MDRDDELLILGGLWFLSQAPDFVRKVEHGGAKIYDMTHPEEVDHKNDLPGKRLSKQTLINLATSVGFKDPKVAAAIALAESGGYVNAIGDNSKSFGLWQIHTGYHPEYSREDLSNPLKNAEAAYKVSHGGTQWQWWSTWWSDARHRKGPGQGPYRGHL